MGYKHYHFYDPHNYYIRVRYFLYEFVIIALRIGSTKRKIPSRQAAIVIIIAAIKFAEQKMIGEGVEIGSKKGFIY